MRCEGRLRSPFVVVPVNAMNELKEYSKVLRKSMSGNLDDGCFLL